MNSSEAENASIIQAINLSPAWEADMVMAPFKRGKDQYERKPLKEFLEDLGIVAPQLEEFSQSLPQGAILAGGYLTSLFSGVNHFKDLDFYFTSEHALKETLALFLKPEGSENRKTQSLFGGYHPDIPIERLQAKEPPRFIIGLTHPDKPPVELMKAFWYQDAEHVIDTFDFTIVQFALEGGDIVFHPEGPADLKAKRLVLKRIQRIERVAYRTQKWVNKGYSLQPG